MCEHYVWNSLYVLSCIFLNSNLTFLVEMYTTIAMLAL